MQFIPNLTTPLIWQKVHDLEAGDPWSRRNIGTSGNPEKERLLTPICRHEASGSSSRRPALNLLCHHWPWILYTEGGARSSALLASKGFCCSISRELNFHHEQTVLWETAHPTCWLFLLVWFSWLLIWELKRSLFGPQSPLSQAAGNKRGLYADNLLLVLL